MLYHRNLCVLHADQQLINISRSFVRRPRDHMSYTVSNVIEKIILKCTCSRDSSSNVILQPDCHTISLQFIKI